MKGPFYTTLYTILLCSESGETRKKGKRKEKKRKKERYAFVISGGSKRIS